MDGKFCDRCNKPYPVIKKPDMNEYIGVKRVYRIHDGHEFSEKAYTDLCPECMASFEHWLKFVAFINSERAAIGQDGVVVIT